MIVFAPNRLCPLRRHAECGDAWTEVSKAIGANPYREREFSIRQCPECGLGFTDPVPTAETAAELYASREDSEQFQSADSGLVAWLKSLAARRDIQAMCRGMSFDAGESLLDFGCGNAAFVAAMRGTFPRAAVFGADYQPDPPPALDAESYIAFPRLFESGRRFDMILCRHVLEHTYDPVDVLRRIASLLRPGGTTMVEVPSLETPVKSLFGKYWHSYYAPYHPLHFTRKPLADAVRAAGLEVTREGGGEMPRMGRSIQAALGCRYSFALFALGMLLQPLQVAVGLATKTQVLLPVWARRPLDA